MLIENILTLQCVRANVDCLSRKKVLELISKIAAERLEEEPQRLFDSIYAREKLGSTGIGNQVAIPHCSTRKASKFVGVLVTLTSPIDFSLEEISKKLEDKELIRLLKTATSDADLYDKIVRYK